MEQSTLISRSIKAYEAGEDIQARALVATFDDVAQQLVKNSFLRSQTGTNQLWTEVGRLWTTLLRDFTSQNEEEYILGLTLSLARLTRNLVAGVPENQAQAFETEPTHRQIIYLLSSYFRGQNEMLENIAKPTTRMLCQMLSNTITGNDELESSLWNSYMSFSDEENILVRLLTFPDTVTKVSTMVLILNCIKGSYRRCDQLTSTPAGIRICITLLDQTALLFDEDEDSAGGHAFTMSSAQYTIILIGARANFLDESSFEVFRCLFDLALTEQLWVALKIDGELITPHQTIFLKLIDSYLQSVTNVTQPMTFLVRPMHDLILFSRSSIRSVLPEGPETDAPPLIAAPDLRLSSTLEALVLLAQTSITLSLAEIEEDEPVETTFITTLRARESFIESIIELLRLLDKFLPRILWGKVQPSAHQLNGTSNAPSSEDVADPAAFAYVKRDLVRLLGILCHESREVQDRVRACGGVVVVLNMCVVDERNPYLREHALFTLRSLLANNTENQQIVSQLEPMGRWDEEGVLRDTPGAVRR